jgi:hypothetical protein
LRAAISTIGCVSELCRERLGRQVAEARMRAHRVVVLAPGLDHDLRLRPRPEPFEAQALVAELAIEALVDAILPGLAGIDQRRRDALIDEPFQKRPRHELGAVVGAQGERRPALRD